jgi:hypothetical protein
MEIKPKFEAKNNNTVNARLVLPDQTAFPSTELMTFGLTKREYFAALAMQALVTNLSRYAPIHHSDTKSYLAYPNMETAVEIADNLINSLNK